MTYVGFSIDIEEALRLFNLDESYGDQVSIQKYLEENKTELIFQYVDKGMFILGCSISKKDDHSFPLYKVDDTIILILTAKKQFKSEMKKLGVDLSNVRIIVLDYESRIENFPEPYVINI